MAVAVAGAIVACAISTPVMARAQDASLDSLALEAGRLTVRYADRRVAAAEGYRRLGADFPGMGEHWLHPGALLAGTIDAARPTILMYAELDGVPTLLGVGFVLVVRDDAVTTGVAGWPAAWHEHSGLLSDESGVAPGTSSPGGTHVWVLHAWTGVKNAAGRYAPDNWALPFRRAGIAAPDGIDADAGRTLSLAVGGDLYLAGLLTDAGLRVPENAARVDSVVTLSARRAGDLLADARPVRGFSAAQVEALRQEWRVLGNRLRGLLGAGVEPFLRAPHDGTHAGHHTGGVP